MTKLQNDYYTYAYLREDKTPYYIGKGRGRRIYSKSRVIKPPADKSRIIFLKKNLTEAEAFKHEVYMIFVLGRKDLGTGILRNLTNGGEGASGAVISAETKKKLSEASTGKTHTEKAKKKCSESMSGENHPMYGVPRTEAQKKAHSERMSGRTHTEKAKKKMSEAKSGEKNPQYGRTGALCFNSKAITAIQPDGTQRHFVSGTEAARELGINQGTLRYYLKIGYVLKGGKFKEWQFLFKNSEDS